MALLGGPALVLIDLSGASQPWWLFLLVFVGGLLLARLCYQAAVTQAGDYGSLLRVAFDLHRHKILEAMHIARARQSAARSGACGMRSTNGCIATFRRGSPAGPWTPANSPRSRTSTMTPTSRQSHRRPTSAARQADVGRLAYAQPAPGEDR